MGFAEIQAAFAAQAPGHVGPGVAPQNAVQPVHQAPPTFTPSPFGAPPVVTATAFTPAVQPPTSAQPTFQFTPPAGFNPASAPPINPPGERAALAAPAPVQPGPPMHEKFPPLPGIDGVPAPVAAPAEPKRRGREPGAKNAGGMPGVVAEETNEQRVARLTAMPENGGPGVSLAADGADISKLPPDGSSVEDIVSELFARGVSSVHLTFTKDGK